MLLFLNKRVICLFFFICIFNCLNFAQSRYTNDPSVRRDPTGYKLRTGDNLVVYVQGEIETKIDAVIDGDGFIKPVYLKEIKISGLSTSEIENRLEIEYKRQQIFQNPSVKVYISKYSERVVYLSGSVNKQGPYTFPPEVEAMNIVEVIARAGGFNPIAQKKKVYVTRTFYDTLGNTKDTKTYEVNVDALSTGTIDISSRNKFWIYPGDRIEVPERLI